MHHKRIRAVRWAPLFGALVACGAEPSPPPITTVATRTLLAEDADCEEARTQRARVAGLLESGRLDRAVRVIRRADDLCPESAPDSWADLLMTLSNLGRREEALALAARIESSPRADAPAKQAARAAKSAAHSAQPPNVAQVRQWVQQALDLRAQGQPATAQRLLDRARVAAEQATKKPVTLTVIADTTKHVSLFQSSDPYVLVEENRARVFDGATLQELRRFPLTPKVVSSAMSEDFRYLVTLGGEDVTFRIWDLASGKLVQKLTDIPESAERTVRADDLHYYVGWNRFAWANSPTVNIWDLKRQVPYAAFELHEDVPRVRLTPDDKTAVSVSPKLIAVWDLDRRSLRAQMDRTPTEPIFLDREIFFVAPDQSVRRCVFATGEQQVVARPGKVSSLTVTPDGRYLLVGKPSAKVELWDTERTRRLRSVRLLPKLERGNENSMWTANLSPDASSALVGLVSLEWFGVDLASGEVTRIPGHVATLTVGDRLLYVQMGGGETPEVGWVERGRLAPILRLPATTTNYYPSLSNDGQRVGIALQDGTVLLLDARSLKIEQRFSLLPDVERAVEFGKHTPALALEGWAAPNLLDIPTGKLAMAPLDRADDVLWASYGRDHRVLLTHHNGSVRDWDLDDRGRSRTLRGKFEGINRGGTLPDFHDSSRLRIASFPNGSVVREIEPTGEQCTAGSRDGRWFLRILNHHSELELYDLSRSGPPHKAETDRYLPCPGRVLADGELFCRHSDRDPALWRTHDGSVVHAFQESTLEHLLDLSEDGSLGAFADGSGAIEVQGAEPHGAHWTREALDGAVSRGRFSRDGRLLAIAFQSGVIRVFSAHTGGLRAHLDGHHTVNALDFDQSGELLVSLTGAGDPGESDSGYAGDRLVLWNVPEETLLATLIPVYDREYPVVLAPTGEVDPGSDESSHLGCKAGIHVFPFALCQERFAVPGLLSRALAGDVSYRDP